MEEVHALWSPALVRSTCSHRVATSWKICRVYDRIKSTPFEHRRLFRTSRIFKEMIVLRRMVPRRDGGCENIYDIYLCCRDNIVQEDYERPSSDGDACTPKCFGRSMRRRKAVRGRTVYEWSVLRPSCPGVVPVREAVLLRR